jgi:hypothetical protein
MLFWLENDINTVMCVTQFVFTLSHCSSRQAGLNTGDINFRRSVTMFSMKRLVIDHWNNHDDVFLSPHFNR